MAKQTTNDLPLKFFPLRSFIHNDFWHKYAEIKLDLDRLDESGRSILGIIPMRKEGFTVLELACSSFNATYNDAYAQAFRCNGIMLNFNTLESFKKCDKTVLLKSQARKFYQELMKKETIQSSAELIHFFLLSFSDLKNYKFYHWFAFPTPIDLAYECDLAEDGFSESFRECFNTFLYEKPSFNEPFFMYDTTKGIKLLSEYIQHRNVEANFCHENMEALYFCYYDPAQYGNSNTASWHLRQLLTYIMLTCPALSKRKTLWIRVTGAKDDIQLFPIRIYLPEHVADVDGFNNWAGWEVNQDGKYLPRLTSLTQSMSPECLAESATNLNLKLMKWRLLPSLDLDVISRSKCLLLGAGTLGCNVARSLMAWGINAITIVDCGRVSLSNPVRQSLYRYEDALNGGKPKALIASERLREINPAANITGVDVKIPMPGHPVGQGEGIKEVKEILEKLCKLFQEHDVIFLLTDSRESRWLPTMLGAFYGKLVINVALGFDSYLVMRHGYTGTDCDTDASCPVGFRKIAGSNLGCYFCNDIVAPGNSMKDRTLDQQCTVTRPAVSNMASGLAVELMIALLQDGNSPPAYYRIPKVETCRQEQEPEGLLGILPHSIRGNIASFQTMITATEKYQNCVACSSFVLDRYASDKDDLIINILNGTETLDKIAGLDKMMNTMYDNADMKVEFEFESDSDDS
ncbi:uncharacterized protein LOC128723318 [Anopheles nili]|uniref:uncharacterized protein LOC128723318 n=1 Tax=Anopheles nili TaxID=185578 RepID=UPI00237AEB0F|nr:uncharacterized protein LOC128723318 [Anopheles nili]